MNLRRACAWTLTMGVIALTGCMPKMTKEEMKQAMKSQRPAELDKLNAFAGKWETTAEMKLCGLDEVTPGKGTSTSTWDVENTFLVGRDEFDMGDMGKMKNISIWTWDPKARRYRTWWFESSGSNSTGTAKYDEATTTWHMKSKGRGPMGGTRSSGTVKMVDANTMEWTFKEWPWWDFFGMTTMFEGKGTSKKKG